jgi:SOS-response transcriptional repressor LexA
MSIGLTAKQNAVFQFIVVYLETHHGIAPSYREIADHLGRKSASGIHDIVARLCDRGLIRRLHHHARSIEVVKPADPLEMLPADLRDRLSTHCSFYRKQAVAVVAEAVAAHLNAVDEQRTSMEQTQ